ncbi:MAG: hypothetical protein R3A51_13610 [Nannocystaceae bacterium]|nr:hypothetical protein [Myxococcales bacterium]
MSTPRSVAAPASASERDAPAGEKLRWRLEPGDAWQEEVIERTFVLEHPKIAGDADAPMSTATRIERFEVLEGAREGARLEVTPVEIKVSIGTGDDARTFDASTPADGLVLAAAERLAYLGVPIRAEVTPLGAATLLDDDGAAAASVRARLEGLIVGLTPTEQDDARAALRHELDALAERLREQGSRPVLPEEPVGEGSRWRRTMRLPSLFGGTIRYDLEYAWQARRGDVIELRMTGAGALEPSAALARFIEEASTSVSGVLTLDAGRGALLEHHETMALRVKLRPDSATGPGGVMAGRLERSRRRLEGASP